MKKFVKLPELKLKKETIAKLSKTKMKEVKGGAPLTWYCTRRECQTLGCPKPLYGIDT